MARAVTFDEPAKAARHAALDFDSMAAEISATRALCDSCHSPVVFCHFDLLPGNLMLLPRGRGDGNVAGASGSNNVDERFGSLSLSKPQEPREDAFVEAATAGLPAEAGESAGAGLSGEDAGEGIIEAFTRKPESVQLQFIDFEYSCYSYRGFDWGTTNNTNASINVHPTNYAQASSILVMS
jgi:thiamine kinase-like enzyme